MQLQDTYLYFKQDTHDLHKSDVQGCPIIVCTLIHAHAHTYSTLKYVFHTIYGDCHQCLGCSTLHYAHVCRTGKIKYRTLAKEGPLTNVHPSPKPYWKECPPTCLVRDYPYCLRQSSRAWGCGHSVMKALMGKPRHHWQKWWPDSLQAVPCW